MLFFVTAISVLSIAVSAPTSIDFTALNNFTLNLLYNTHAFQENFGKQNLALSPLSVWSLLSLLAEGSSGDTFQELMQVLQLPRDLKSTQDLHQSVKNILKSNQDVNLETKSAMFTDSTLRVQSEFCETARNYGSEVYLVDPSNTTKLAYDINYFICEASQGRIPNLVKPESLEGLRMMLVDTLFFKAPWTHPFDPTETKEAPFYDSQGKTIGSVNMMYQEAAHSFGDSDLIQAQILEMTYGKTEQFSMLILLPFDGTPIAKLLENLSKQNLDWMTEFRNDGDLKIDCFIPRFKLSSKSDLIPPLQYAGIVSIFNKAKAQLPGVADDPLYVSSTIQNVDIEVNEQGTVAAAATVVGLENRFGSQRFEANKEFVFLILERKSNLILFGGVYSDPSVV